MLAEKAVKDVVAAVDRGIERMQMQQFQAAILHDIEPKTSTVYNSAPFTVSMLCFQCTHT